MYDIAIKAEMNAAEIARIRSDISDIPDIPVQTALILFFITDSPPVNTDTSVIILTRDANAYQRQMFSSFAVNSRGGYERKKS